MLKTFLSCACLALVLTSCTKEVIHPSFKSESSYSGKSAQISPSFAQFKELPIPEQAVMDLKRTLIFGSEPLVGRLAFSTPYSQSSLFDFYIQEMPKFGWKELTTIRTTTSIITFKRDTRIASIRLRKDTVVIDISTARKNLY